MNLIIYFTIALIVFFIFKFIYKFFSKNHKIKKSIKKKEEEKFKHQLLNYHPDFIQMFREFKKDQEEKRKKGYSSDLMISDGGYITNIYGKSIFVYDQHFENLFYQQFDTKYCELVNNPFELEKVRSMIPQH